mgnify:CR=1 FL=1
MASIQSAFGLIAFVLLAWALGRGKGHRGGIEGARAFARFAIAALALQVGLAALFVHAPGSAAAFEVANRLVLALQEATRAGTALVFGYLGGGEAPFEANGPGSSFILAFQALPLVLVISAIGAVLFHWGVMQRIVGGFAWALRKTLGIGGPLGVGSAANIFIGMVEAPVLVRPYVATMPRSDLFALMVCGMATIAGTVLALYAQFLQGIVPGAAGHLIAASVISVPAALLVARLMVPAEGGGGPRDLSVQAEEEGGGEPSPTSTMQALTEGTLAGLQLLLSIVAMLIVLVAIVALINMGLGLLPDFGGEALSLERMLGWAMSPLVWLAGVPWDEAAAAGRLMGIKTALNELLGFLAFAQLPADALGPRSEVLMTYALCGFANPGSVGIMIGGLSAMAPARRREIASLAMPALAGGTLATLMTAAAVGIVL